MALRIRKNGCGVLISFCTAFKSRLQEGGDTREFHVIESSYRRSRRMREQDRLVSGGGAREVYSQVCSEILANSSRKIESFKEKIVSELMYRGF